MGVPTASEALTDWSFMASRSVYNNEQSQPPQPACPCGEEMRKDIKAIRECLLGKSGEWRGGLVERVDRVEQKQESHTFWTRTAIGAGVSAIVGTVWVLITGGK